jgi:preprotein translocase subunit SecG
MPDFTVFRRSLFQHFMRRSVFWLLLALLALSVVVHVAVADSSDDGSDDEADDLNPSSGGQASGTGDAHVDEDDDEGAYLPLSLCSIRFRF